MNYTIEDVKIRLKEILSPERYEHSLGTAEAACILAKEYKLDDAKAYFTGLIHDCAKCLPKDTTLEIIKNMDLVCGELDNPKTHHAPAGVYIAKKEFNVTDEEVLSSIRWHTIGKLAMTDFEKIIFLADKIEKRTRSEECAQPIRDALKTGGLDAALLVCYKGTIKSLVARDLTICTMTVDIYNSLLNSH